MDLLADRNSQPSLIFLRLFQTFKKHCLHMLCLWRLQQISEGVDLIPFIYIVFAAGQKDNRKIRIQGTEFPGDCHTIHFFHINIQKTDIELLRFKSFQETFSAVKLCNIQSISFMLKRNLDQLDQELSVIDIIINNCNFHIAITQKLSFIFMYKSIAYRGSHIQFLFTDSTTDSTKADRKTICLTFDTIWTTLIEDVFRKRYKKDI